MIGLNTITIIMCSIIGIILNTCIRKYYERKLNYDIRQ